MRHPQSRKSERKKTQYSSSHAAQSVASDTKYQNQFLFFIFYLLFCENKGNLKQLDV
jgi:hypothetical protein